MVTFNQELSFEYFSNRIEIVSPDGLPLGLLKEEYLEGRISKSRNSKIADIFLRLKIIEKLATGVRRIKEQYMEEEVKPEFIVSENLVVVVLPYVKESSNKGSKSKIRDINTLSEKEQIIYQLIKKEPSIKRLAIQDVVGLEKSQTIELLNNLRRLGWIVKVGNGPATGYRIIE